MRATGVGLGCPPPILVRESEGTDPAPRRTRHSVGRELQQNPLPPVQSHLAGGPRAATMTARCGGMAGPFPGHTARHTTERRHSNPDGKVPSPPPTQGRQTRAQEGRRPRPHGWGAHTPPGSASGCSPKVLIRPPASAWPGTGALPGRRSALPGPGSPLRLGPCLKTAPVPLGWSWTNRSPQLGGHGTPTEGFVVARHDWPARGAQAHARPDGHGAAVRCPAPFATAARVGLWCWERAQVFPT